MMTRLSHAWALLAIMLWAGLARANAELPYAGRLTAADGTPVTGPVNLEVSFFDGATSGNQLGQTLSFPNQSLADGIPIRRSPATWRKLQVTWLRSRS